MSGSAEKSDLSLKELGELAQLPRDERWQRLLSRLTELFIGHASDYSASHGDAFGIVVCDLLDRVGIDARKELSTRVAELEQFPTNIVQKLARDEHEVAAPVLENSPLLSDSELIAVASIMMQEHLVSISKRKFIGTRLTDALVKHENIDVIHELAGNTGAKLSDTTYRVVAELAKKDTDLQEKLVSRGDMTPTVVVQLAPFLSKELMDRLNAPDESDGFGLLDSLNEFISEGGGAKKNTKAAELASADEKVAAVKAGEAELNAVITEIADREQLNGLCHFIAGIAGVAEKTVTASILNKNVMPIAIICRGLGLTADAFEAVCYLRCERMNLPQAEIVQHLDQFKGLKAADAKKSLAVLQAKGGAA